MQPRVLLLRLMAGSTGLEPATSGLTVLPVDHLYRPYSRAFDVARFDARGRAT
jgi:hypothetical protein